jgi:hypothetical protein
MTFPALGVFYARIGGFPLFFVIVGFRSFHEVDDDVFDAVSGLGVEKFHGILGCRQVAVHAVGHEPLGVVHVSGRLPGIVSESNFMAARTEPRRRCADHGVVGKAEERKADDETQADEKDRLQPVSHGLSL